MTDDPDKLNWSMRFKRRHPRTWGFMVVVPLLLVTVIVCPISFLWDVVYEIPRMLRNFWDDLYHTIRGHARWYWIAMSAVYVDVWAAICGKQKNEGNEK